MQCELCQVNEATLTFKRVVDGDLSDLHVCETCASSHGLGTGKYSLEDILLGHANADMPPPPAESCPVCGLTFEELHRVGRVGCEQCYEAFFSYLMPMVARMQPGVLHVGSAPMRLQQHETLAELREELGEAVSLQEFERAAELRDRIHELERGLLGEDGA